MQPSDWIAFANLLLTGLLIIFTVREARINSEYRNKEKIFETRLDRLARIRELVWANVSLFASFAVDHSKLALGPDDTEPILRTYQQQVAEAEALISTFSDSVLTERWNIYQDDKVKVFDALKNEEPDTQSLSSKVWKSAANIVKHTYTVA